MSEEKTSRAQFATRLGVIAATVGSSVGLGNIWRFPYEAGTHGGGAFLLCYLGFTLLLGIPVICAEFIMGRGSRSNIFGAFRKFSGTPRWNWVGYMSIVASMMILSFYSVIAGWTVEYCWASITGQMDLSSAAAFHERFDEFTSGNWRPVLWTLIFLALNYLVLRGGVTKGIERVSNILMPLLFVILVAFCINSATLPAAREGYKFFFHPDFSKITPQTLIAAMGQSFFSLSIGLGCMMTYASYFNKRVKLVRTAGIIAGLDVLTAVLAAMVIFPAVFSFGMSPEQGPKLVFEVLPTIFHQMPGGIVWSTLFFFLLFMASLTSTISMSEISIAFFIEERGMSRKGATLLNTVICAVVGVLCALSFGCLSDVTLLGQTVFDICNNLSSNILLPVGGLAIAVFVGWRLSRTVINEQLSGHGYLIRPILFLLRYVAPVAIFVVLLNAVGVF